MTLAAERHGEGGPRPLVIAHGLFGSARNWRSVAKALADDRAVIAVDMRNHGASPNDPSMAYADMAADLAGVADGPVDLLGHSMGGKAAMMLALTDPDRVARLIVVDMAPAAYDHAFDDILNGLRAVDPAAVSRRSEADEALAAHIDTPGIRAFLLQSLDLAEGRWSINVDALDREMDTITGWPEPGGTYDGPALFLSGETSDYLTRDHRDGIRALFPQARFAELKGVGHWLHAEAPEAFVGAVRTFLAETQAS